MKKEIIMPALTDDMKEGVVARILFNVGDNFLKGDILFEVETDKVISEVEALEDGKIDEFLVDEGDKVKVGKTIGYYITK